MFVCSKISSNVFLCASAAKNHAPTIEGGMSPASLGSNLQNLSVSSSMNREQPIPCSSEVDGGVEGVASSDLTRSNSSTANNPDRMEECLNHAEKGNEGSPADQLAAAKSEMNVDAECEAEERVQVQQGHSLDEQTEKSMTQSPQDCDSSRSSGKVEQSSESVGVDEALSEDDIKLTTRSSHSYDGSVSSPDRSGENRPPHKYLHLSKRTFRRKKVLDSVDSIQLRGKSLDERGASAIRGNFLSNRDELPPRPQMERDTTFGSEDFHSIQNWIGSESDDGALKSLSDDLLFHTQNDKPSTKLDALEPDHMKILRKVDELRDELTGFLTRRVEGKRASRFRHQVPHIPFSGRPPCSSYLPLPHYMYGQANLPSYLHKAQTEENWVEKLQCKEKKLAVKNYCRPVSGGAPFVVCYKCWKLLQLPADFLVTRKRLHKLKCGACSAVLVFSFRPRARTAPMTPVEVRHPPSEVDNNNDRPRWDPMSFSDDYGVSFVRSYSSEAEAVLHVSRNSSYSIDGRDSQQVTGSRLHRLMGYSSASELLFRPPGVDEGYQSTEPSTPQFYRPSEDVMRFRLNGTGTVTPKSMEIEEENDVEERLRTRKRGSALQGLLKKGVRELSQGLESVKLKIHSNG